MAFYLGKPGSFAMITLPHPGRGIDASNQRLSRTSETIGGGRQVTFAPGPGRREWRLPWRSLTPEQASVLEEFATGARGPGPFCFLDPGRRNHLTANQSAATSVDLGTTGFTPSASETVASSSTLYVRGPRSLKWSVTSATAGVLKFDAPGSYAGMPVPPATTWTLQAAIQPGGADTSFTIGAALVWLNSAGSTVATTVGPAVATTASTWNLIVATGTCPATALYVRPEIRVTAGVSTTSDVYVDKPMLDMHHSVRPWVLGTGIPLVSVTEMGTTYRTLPRRGADLTLVEVG